MQLGRIVIKDSPYPNGKGAILVVALPIRAGTSPAPTENDHGEM